MGMVQPADRMESKDVEVARRQGCEQRMPNLYHVGLRRPTASSFGGDQ